MRREDNFQKLVKKKKVIIPIIQRDYAQGRNNSKAIVVRTRLIDEWVDILQDNNLRMDFNYIYGNENSDVFYPVDGQQRLTSLYLLHWYLAQATGNGENIKEWAFDYRTRNSASEFFAFLREPERSEKLFAILSGDGNTAGMQKAIRDENWFKSKWENDPTVVSCINFLCMLANKLRGYRAQFGLFWERLKDAEHPAIYFTCLSERDDEYAETEAAKKYTRMNARGKRLTDFENLKAMIDELEESHIEELKYCSGADASDRALNTISWAYDRKYIDCFYQSLAERSLQNTTKMISSESENWFRLVYYVYALAYERAIPRDKNQVTEGCNESYEDTIYKVSQGRVKDEKITDYLYMLKATLEVICNSDDKIAYRYDVFSVSDILKRKDAIAFVLFISGLWDKDNRREDNVELLQEWHRFKSMLHDLRFKEWQLSSEREFAAILISMVEGIKKTTSKSVDEYFISNDFESNNPFGEKKVLSDIKCRLQERKIKSKLIYEGTVTEKEIDSVAIGNRRWGYLYYLCGFLNLKTLGDWSKMAPWNGKTVTDYIAFISANGSVPQLMNKREAKAVFAYSTQYDVSARCLNNEAVINQCNNEHIWKDMYLLWQDDEFDSLEVRKQKQLDHLKVMLDFLLVHKASMGTSYDRLLEEYEGVIREYFDNHGGYENCWLRFVVQYTRGGSELLTSELENENGVVTLKGVPVILKVFLQENGYLYVDKIKRLDTFYRKCNFFTANDRKVLFSETDQVCTFLPDPDNTGRYQHSTRNLWGWDLSGNSVTRNMDLYYRVYLNLSAIGVKFNNGFMSMDICDGNYTMKVYEISGINAGKVCVTVKEAKIDAVVLAQADSNMKQWCKRFDDILKSPSETGNYDRWIELWNDDFKTAFGSSFIQGAVAYDKTGGQRPRKYWSEVLTVPALSWKMNTVEF